MYTDLGRKYIDELKCMGKKCIVYYIANRNNLIYARQIATDIHKMFSYLHKLNVFYKSNTSSSNKIDIVTLKENRDIIDKVLKCKTNIIE